MEQHKYECKKHGTYTAGPFLKLPNGRFMKPPCPKCYDEQYMDKSADDSTKLFDFQRCVVKDSGIPVRFMGCRLDSYKPENEMAGAIFSQFKKYVDDFSLRSDSAPEDSWFQPVFGPKSLIFLGNNGTGKTHIASTLSQELLFAGKIASFKYYSAYDLSLMIKNSWFRESSKSEMQVMKDFIDLDLLIIDEVGVQFGTETDMLLFFQVFNKRLAAEKPTILISNFNGKELKGMVGPRIIDRLKENLVFTFSWESYRGKQSKGEK